nr:hypothetical protein [Methanosarcina spherical virus]
MTSQLRLKVLGVRPMRTPQSRPLRKSSRIKKLWGIEELTRIPVNFTEPASQSQLIRKYHCWTKNVNGKTVKVNPTTWKS